MGVVCSAAMETFEERFWRQVEKTEDCWNCLTSTKSTGYGRISRNGRQDYMHRISWEMANGPIPDGLCVLHRCDNPRCVRPEHLFLGTRGDNNRDTHTKGRWHYVPAGHGRRKVATGAPKGKQPAPPAERFWPKVDTHEGAADVCWEFLGTRDKYGYGAFWINELRRKTQAHRIAYALHYGDFDRSLMVMHTCDNPPCCNPSHLRLGTRADNNRDRDAKGRTSRLRGERSPTAKLSQSDVDEIKRLVAVGETQINVAERFGVKQPQVSRIVRGVSWN